MGQARRENTKAEVAFDPLRQRHDGQGVIPGYRGHVPNVMNAVGMTTFLSGPGYTEIRTEEMEKAGGLADLGDSASAYGCNDWGASAFTGDGRSDFASANPLTPPGSRVRGRQLPLQAGGGVDGSGSAAYPAAAAARARDSLAQAGHVDQHTFGDAMAERAAAARERGAAEKVRRDAAIRAVRGF